MITKRRLRAMIDPLAWKVGEGRSRGQPPSGLLLIEAGGLGDVLLLAAVIDAFRPLVQEGEPIRLLLRKESTKTAFAIPPGIKVDIFDFYRLMTDVRYRFQSLAEVRSWNMRKAVSLDWRRHPWMDDALLMAAAHGAEFSAAFHPKPWPKFGQRLEMNAHRLTRLVEVPRPATMIERWLHLSQALTGQKPHTPRLRLHDSHLSVTAEKLDRPTILFSPFASSRDKQARVDFWETMSTAFPGFDIRLLAGPGDLDRNPDFKSLAEKLNVIERPFQALLPLLKSASLVIATDSATLHLATLSEVATLAIASAAYVGEVLPHAPSYAPANLKVMLADMPCRGCIGDCTLPFRGEQYECVARLDVGEAIRIAREMLL